MASAVIGIVVVPLLLVGGPVALASFRSPTAWSSWQTVWALLDGNLRTGLLGAPSDHFDPALATLPVGNPSWVTEWVKLMVFGLLCAGVFWKARLRESPRRLMAFVCLTLVLFFLWSKGWSPQWQSLLFPLLLLVLPLRHSVLFILALSLVSMAEWPVLLSRGLFQWLYLTVLLRTGLLVFLAVDLWRRISR